MKELENKTLQSFLDNLIEALKDEKESRGWDNKNEENKAVSYTHLRAHET